MSATDDAWKKVEDLIEKVERSSERLLTKAERNLVERLMNALYQYEKDKNLNAKRDLTMIVDEVLNDFQSNELKPIVETISKEIVATVKAINSYFKLQIKGSNFLAFSKKIEKDLLGKMGIELSESSFKIITGGYMDSLTNNPELRNGVSKIIIDSVFNASPFSDMMKSLIRFVEGTDMQEGKLLRHFKTMALDTFNIAARAQEDLIAKEFNMDAFLFTGTVIETTRCFCKERAGKVILTNEATTEWPVLRNEKCGPRWDDDLEYIPLKHMGGHRCRHHKRYITNSEAIRRDSTIKSNEKGELYRAV
jgi:hypothetical protein